MDISPFLKLMVDKNASDLFFSVGAAPHMKIQGVSTPIGDARMKSQQMRDMAAGLMNEDQKRAFERDMEITFAVSRIGVGRFRVNLYRQRGEIALVVCYLKGVILPLQDLLLPGTLAEIVMMQHGLVIVAGGLNAGKSTTLAAMIDYRNEHQSGHILTIEDPVEYLYQHKKSIVNQREVGLDTVSHATALDSALRESPDVLMLGQLASGDILKKLFSIAEAGCLCLTTVIAENTRNVLERMVGMADPAQQKHMLQMLAIYVRAIITVKCIPGLQQKRVPAVEIMMNTPDIADCIQQGNFQGMESLIIQDKQHGMQSFDQSIAELFKAGRITQENAMRFASSRSDLMTYIQAKNISVQPMSSSSQQEGDALVN